ncbi:MAG: T9SS type A sorting domain-containing protein [Bacteroidales bacterium]|nr:T9SS type A sorting domain-containing protein [Bacteroidales bacterium]MCF8332973.1 T9SS type A sorting domain-containing protein [Bacteroidales bacterium]
MKGRNLLLNLFVVLMGLSLTVSAQENNNSTNDQKTYLEKARANQHTGTIDPADVLKAREQMKKMDQSRALGLNWREVGPDNFGGHTTAILIDNQDPSGNTIYVGAFTGGIWKTTNGGLIWNKINSANQNIFITAITQGADGTIYASTGARDEYIGQGIYKSTDGNTFQLIASTEPTYAEDDTWAYVTDIEVHEGDLYAATNTGLMISTDGGESWEKAANEEGALDGFCQEVEVATDGVIYMDIEGDGYRSDSGPSDFVTVSGSSDTLIPSYVTEKLKFAAAPSDASIVYAVAIDDDGELVDVYLSEDAGISWRVIGPGGTNIFSPFAGGTGLDAATLKVAPQNPDKIYLGGTYVYEGVNPGDGGYFAWERSFMAFGLRVEDMAFKNSNSFYTATSIGVIGYIGGELKTFNKFLNISSFNAVSLGIDDKVLGGEDLYGILHFDMTGNTDLSANSIYSGRGGYVERSVLRKENIILSAVSQGSNVMERSRDLGESFGQNFLAGEVGDYTSDFAPFELWESFNNPESHDSVYFKAYESHQAGDEVLVKSNTVDYPFEYTLEAPLNEGDSVQVHDVVTARLFIAADDGSSYGEVWMSPEVHLYGQQPVWYQVAELERRETPTSIDVSESGNYVYVGTEGGVVYRLSNLLMAHDSATAMYNSSQSVVAKDTIFFEEDRMVTSISVDPNDENHVVVTLGNYGNDSYVYESFNTLDDQPGFNDISYNLPDVPVYSSLIEMHSSERVIIGSEFGVFSLENDAWSREYEDIGAVPITQIRQQTQNSKTKTVMGEIIGNDTAQLTFEGIQNNGMIYISTYGRGLWKSANYVGIGDQPENHSTSVSSLEVYPNPAREKVSFSLKKDENWIDENAFVHIYDINGRLVLSQSLNATDSEKTTVNVSSLKEGAYMMQITNGRKKTSGKFMILR